ncbi:MAG: glycyl-radical enzyme activating protein, partial [Oscillospiraceae bacterium]|nr:glycyl-radical enzyme activating protein [Oscillospiraceae bacterium]
LYTKNDKPAGLVTNIQKYTIHDGPGIRTEVFFSGCSLSCIWCSNPETIAPGRKFGIYPNKCIGRGKCSWCVKACPIGGTPILFDGEGVLSGISPAAQCADCFRCADDCPSRAIKVWGELYTVSELMEIIRQDRSFYDRTGGGVTLSGGEVLLQAEFAEALLAACRAENINTCVESALFVPWETAERVFALADLVITDIKHMDSAAHVKITGAGNELILENIKKTVQTGKKLVIRTPVVIGYNADERNIRATAEFIRDQLGGQIVAWQLLPYRKMGTEKYDSLMQPYPLEDYTPPEREEWEANLRALTEMVQTEYGLPVVAGSSEKLKL